MISIVTQGSRINKGTPISDMPLSNTTMHDLITWGLVSRGGYQRTMAVATTAGAMLDSASPVTVQSL